MQLVTAYNNADSSNNLNVQLGLVAQINGVGAVYSSAAAANPYVFFPAGNSGVYLATVNGTTSYNNVSLHKLVGCGQDVGSLADCEVHEGFLRRCGEL